MKRCPASGTLCLVGEIVELREERGSRRAKILLKSVCIDVSLRDSLQLSLGDAVVLETRIETPMWRRMPQTGNDLVQQSAARRADAGPGPIGTEEEKRT